MDLLEKMFDLNRSGKLDAAERAFMYGHIRRSAEEIDRFDSGMDLGFDEDDLDDDDDYEDLGDDYGDDDGGDW